MVVTLDGATAAAAETLNPGLRRPPLVDMSAAVPWCEAFGAPLQKLLRAHGVGGARLPALRQAALVARMLELQTPAGPYAGRPLFEHILITMAPPDALAAEGYSDGPH